MTPASAARRYARALFDVVLIQKGDLDRTQRELEEFAALLHGDRAVASALMNPAVPAAKKRAVIDAIVTQSGDVSDPVARTLSMLAERDRLGLTPDLARTFAERLMDHRNIVRAEVTTAIPLDAAKHKAIADALGRATGRQVVVEPKVDAGILGGVVARVGSVVYDGSIARQLEKMKESLVESGQ
ncbi:MAG: ATP synthase F1 subunit delta [Acidobacteriota bacterium]|nr:ATP synthase F1 subunit delta [Acidobacteriota bacterium]